MKIGGGIICGIFTLLLVAPCVSIAQSAGSKRVNQLPRVQCDRFNCSLVDRSSSQISTITPASPNPYPVDAGPPPGQRMRWVAPGHPSCQVLGNSATLDDPYYYIVANEVPVPLGSTHASILVTLEGNLSGGDDTEAAGIYGLVEIRRSGVPSWEYSGDFAVFTVHGFNHPQSLFGRGTFQGFERLGSLSGGTGVPELVDIRVGVFNLFTSGWTTNFNEVCFGIMDVTF